MKVQIKLEKKIVRVLKQKRLKIYYLICISLFLLTIPYIPYANVLLDLKTALLSITLVYLLLFRIPLLPIFILVSVLFTICMVFLLLNQFDRAEEMGDYIFNILVIQVLLFIFSRNGKEK